MKEKTGGILFDYNGVIVDDELLHEKAAANTLAHYGVHLAHDVFEDYCLGRTDKEAAETLKKVFPKIAQVSTDNLVKEKLGEYQKISQQESTLYPGVEKLIETLNREFIMVLVTGSIKLEVQPILQRAALENFFVALITAEDTQYGKPNPEGYLKGLKILDLPKEKVVAVEDSPRGVEAAKAADIKCIAVLHTVPSEKLQNADLIVKRVTDITPELIRQVLP